MILSHLLRALPPIAAQANRAKLASCCDAVQNFVVSQNNTPVGTNMSYEPSPFMDGARGGEVLFPTLLYSALLHTTLLDELLSAWKTALNLTKKPEKNIHYCECIIWAAPRASIRADSSHGGSGASSVTLGCSEPHQPWAIASGAETKSVDQDLIIEKHELGPWLWAQGHMITSQKVTRKSQPFVDYPYNQCAVVGNGGILNKSLCGAEIDKSDFVFRCNLPPTTGDVSKDVGSKTNLVTVNPSIITLKYGNLKEKKALFLEDIATYGDAFLLLPAFSFRANTGTSFKVYYTLEESKARQKVLFFHPKYLKHLALFWRTKGVTAYRLSTGLMITSVAVELCENVKLYGFWPFSKTIEDTPVSHHYYDNMLPKRGFHQMPKEYSQILQLHVKGILKLQFSKCEVA
ncbi:Alpha-2,8-sialyltransferase 8F [Saguinus oedipus]|uniref:Alpha-2,8-sialyltransferase 8F n=1 Tax=Saguinus oedipus TaxID=9490 RepID=A0ABQ9V7Q5_SAGOE|nr:Alpha-2,8-sialyltransferase 8F [Saguinus oedipus]